ncbi:hypothetical protein [Streptomyces ardesiacus]|uniref:hypothetical protein n=1 Tax=Streptomyces ardesiacus TaxID=285564 RepID=UPI00380069FE
MTATKWELITNEVDRAWMERTPFGYPCVACGEWLATEADFAKHFEIPDPAYKNTGNCPKSKRK